MVSYILPILLFLFVIATLAVLICGVIVMGKGGKSAPEISNKLMIARVCMQGLAILVLCLIFATSGGN